MDEKRKLTYHRGRARSMLRTIPGDMLDHIVMPAYKDGKANGLLRAAEIAADIGLSHLKLMALPGAKRPDPAMVAEEIQRAILKEAEGE